MIKISDDEKLQIYREMLDDISLEEKLCKKALFLKFYKSLLQEEAKLVLDLANDKNTDVIFSIYHYLILNGWFSCSNHFQIAACPDELYSKPEMSVCIGGGCCRHIAPHFANIMNYIDFSFNKKFCLVGTNYETHRSKLPESSEITYSIDDYSFDYLHSGEEVDYHYPNHIEVLSKTEHTLYDPLNFNIQKIDRDNKSQDNYIGPMDLAFGMIYDSSISSLKKYSMLEEKFYKDITCYKRYSLSEKELIALRDIGIDICLSNMDRIKDYKEKNEGAYQYIKREAKKYTHNCLTDI